ncbi:cortical protein marker for cell polarity-domain-containing protein [Desarmillaria tabescens]|uniref:Cortical protein marker for cell polarity-domain-containing protein n=1 Tax=Armillaria tabescens TaxID=1929756 RepID=A0AA39N9B8_ARMTA|nr:cortical protein marker for cell polarity-domain-containing protein [Desarmillaria tabescens]KAK0461417.1 cortical protein marker for cell polarity-domain-containing protein [Desarmillaria tabescens]
MQLLRCLFSVLLANAVLAALPLVDFDRMGKVGLVGTFAGLDFFQNSSSTLDASTATLLSRSDNGELSILAATNTGGRIVAGCVLDDVFYFGGLFSSIGSTSAVNVASYTASSDQFAALGSNGPNGEIDAVFCDDKNKKLWAGGSFTSPGSSIAVWDPSTSSWSAPPFKGVTGANAKVLSITTNSSESSLFFSGSFITSFQGNGTTINSTNNPNVPFSAGATPFSSSLVPIPLQNAEIVASPSSTDANFGNISNILCPAGEDGAGNTWFAADQNTAVITARTFSYITADGIRLGNTFLGNHGTTGFSVTTIPDNTVRTLRYLDPTINENVTCTDLCPADFLFEEDRLSITGVEVKLSEWTGNAPGLHIFQLLSSGAFASAVDSENSQSCYAPIASNATRTGDWQVKVANTNISGTTQSILVSTVEVGTSAANGPSMKWVPYVSASGEYEMNMLIPGCTNFQDCDMRTSVQVTVFPAEGLEPVVTQVSQQSNDDAVVLIYSGPVIPSSSNFVTTVTMTLSDNPAGSGQGGQYELVADRIELVLTSANITANSSSTSSSTSSSASGTRNSFGFFEWPLDSESTNDATATLPNSTETSLEGVGFDIYSAVGSTSSLTSSNSAIATVAHHTSGLFVGGNFTLSSGSASGARNIAVYRNSELLGLNGGGLNGPVTASVLVGNTLYVGGSFDDTIATATSGLSNIAAYNVQADEWSPLEGGLNGKVTSLGYSNGQVLIAGEFTEAMSSLGGSSSSVGGFAVWDIAKSSWANSGGFIVGDLSFFVSGNCGCLTKVRDSDTPGVQPLGIELDSNVNNTLSSSPSAASKRRREHHSRASPWMPHAVFSRFWSRQSSSSTNLTSLPTPISAPAPSVLAGAFWTNSTSSVQVAIIGGNFSFTNGGTEASAVAIYDSNSGSLNGLKGSQINGTVRTLLVDGDVLYIGGQFTVSGISVNGFAVYNLANQEWDTSGLQGFQASSGSVVTVYSITTPSSKDNTIIVAGSFAQAGSLPCQGICSMDTTSKQWNALGQGIQGEVSSVSYAGDNEELLIAAGSIALSGNTEANVALFSFSNSTWTSIGSGGDIPGPVTALEVNSANSSSIFAAGKTSDGASFLTFWNGQTWNILSSTFESSTVVTQLTMVPLQDTHSSSGIIESDRMLMISGSLDDSSFGNASSALYDGQSYIPYIVSSSSTGSTGAVAALFHSFASFSFTQRHFLATGVVILISIAIAAGVVFLLALIGILWTLFSRRDEKLNKLDVVDDDDDSTHHRPSSLLEHINAATRATVLGGGAYDHYDDKEEEKILRDAPSPLPDADPFGPDESNYLRAETPSDAVGGLMGEDSSRPAHARYSFDGAGEGELPLSAGAEVEVLDDRDAAWWYARDVRTGQEGVVPAAYLY